MAEALVVDLGADAALEAVEMTVDQEAIGQCSKPHAVTVEKSVKYLLGLQTVNPSIAVIVLKKWAQGEKTEKIEVASELRFQNPIKLNLI